MKRLEETFKHLTVLEELLETLSRRGKMYINDNEATRGALAEAVKAVRGRVKTTFAVAKAQKDFRLPDSKVKPESLRDRRKRERKSENLYQKLEDYFDDRRN